MLKSARILILFIILGWGTDLFSQHLSHQVLVPVAGVISFGNVNYSQTIGESEIEIIGSSDYVFTQGFQQPSIKFTSEHPPEGTGVDVYPNPVVENLTVKLFGDISRDFRIEIINITGTIVLTRKLSFIDNYNFEDVIPVGHLYRGLYFVRISSMDKIINRTFKIEKM